MVGCGVMGASASYNLAKKGLRVLTLDRHGLNHKLGSSHGRTRIIRTAYYEDPRYVPLLRRAYESWREVEAKSGKKLLEITGGLMVGRPDGELIPGVLRSAAAHGIPVESLTSAETEGRFGAFTIGEEYAVVFEQSAGVLFAEECVRALVGLGSEAGGEFRFSEEARSWKSGSDGVSVETPLGTQTADRLVLCAGSWNGGLLGGLLPLNCERQVPLWFDSGGSPLFSPPNMPVFMMEETNGAMYYGIPELGHGVKVARTHGGEIGDPDKVRREVTDADVDPVRGFMARHLKGLDGPPVASTTCLYTNTPDLNFAVGRHPTDQKVTVLSACSGHGFKFASVIGEVVASMVTGEPVSFDLSFLDPGRFARNRQA